MGGKILWTDLTVENAEQIKAFYSQVVGWTPEAASMGDYDDFNMLPSGEKEPSAGICHARGGNADIPPVWMVYLAVEHLDNALKQCIALGGTVVKGPKEGGCSAIIKDPAGAICTLYQE